MEIMNFADECAQIEREASHSSEPDYYRAQAYKMALARAVAKAIELSAQVATWKSVAGSIDQAMATLEVSPADALSDNGAAHLCEVTLSFFADSTYRRELGGNPAFARIAKSLSNHMEEAANRSPMVIAGGSPAYRYQDESARFDAEEARGMGGF